MNKKELAIKSVVLPASVAKQAVNYAWKKHVSFSKFAAAAIIEKLGKLLGKEQAGGKNEQI